MAPKADLYNELPMRARLSPALYHFSGLLASLEESEQSLISLRQHAHSELNLVQRYFVHAEKDIKHLNEGARTPSPDREGYATRRREKWSEMQRMRKYESEIGKLTDTVAKREACEVRLRGLLKLVGEVMLEREVLARETSELL